MEIHRHIAAAQRCTTTLTGKRTHDQSAFTQRCSPLTSPVNLKNRFLAERQASGMTGYESCRGGPGGQVWHRADLPEGYHTAFWWQSQPTHVPVEPTSHLTADGIPRA